ncbi:MAG: malate dehydrogenase [Coriobacteriales bacterium]|jgi:malate dehydrogenase|nr:malate dehydrogenase [Coriobacteriales bacterium]
MTDNTAVAGSNTAPGDASTASTTPATAADTPGERRLPKITVVGAGNVGATTGLLLVLRELADVVLIDIAEGVARGKALDIMQMRSNERFGPRISGTGSYADTANSDIVVVTAGIPRRPGMTREELLEINSGIVRSVLNGALEASPNALYVFVTNPLDVMCNLAWEIASSSPAALPPARLMGMGGVLDTARFIHAIAEATGAEPAEIEALVVGAHGEAMVPLAQRARVGGRPLNELLSAEQIKSVVDATVNGGAAVVELLQTGSAFYAPASSIVQMVTELLQPTGKILSVCARLNGEYGISDVSICVPVRLGKNGVEEVVELELAPAELSQLRASAEATKQQLGRL